MMTAMPHQLLLLVLILALAGCVSTPSNLSDRRYVCSAFCYLRNKEGALEREVTEGRGGTVDRAISRLQSACDDKSYGQRGELQVVTNEATDELRAADKTRDCREGD